MVEEEDEPEVYYDKSKSFFDNISCDATSKAQGLVLTSLYHFSLESFLLHTFLNIIYSQILLCHCSLLDC